MHINLSLSLYWLLIPLAIGLLLWVFIDRDDEHGGYLPSLGPLFRLFVSAIIFFVVLSILLGINLWFK